MQGHLKNVLGSRALGRAGGRGSGDEPAASFTVDLLKRVVSSRELTIGQLVAIHRDLGLIGNKNSNGGGGGSGQGGGAFGFLLGNGSAPPPPPRTAQRLSRPQPPPPPTSRSMQTCSSSFVKAVTSFR